METDNQIKKERSLSSRLMRGSAWVLLGRALMAGGGLTVNVMLARLLPVNEVGVFYLMLSIVLFASISAQFGLNKVVVRLTAAELAANRPGGARHILVLSLALAAVISFIIALSIWYFRNELFGLLFGMHQLVAAGTLIALLVFAKALTTLMAEAFRGLHNYPVASLFSGASDNVLLGAALVVCWIMGLDLLLNDAILLVVSVAIISLLLVSIILIINLRQLCGMKGQQTPIEIMHIAAPLFVTSLGAVLMQSMDIWLLGVYQDAAQVGIYASAKRVLLLVVLPLVIINQVMPPMIAELHAQNQMGKLEKVLRKMASSTTLISGIVVVLLFFLGDELLSILFGQTYSGGTPALLILSVGYFFNAWTGSCGNVLIMTGHQKLAMWVTIASGLVLFISGSILAAHYGVQGVAWAVSLSLIVQNLSMLLLVKRLENIWTHAGGISNIYRSIYHSFFAKKPRENS